jgi:hypothetical protein
MDLVSAPAYNCASENDTACSIMLILCLDCRPTAVSEFVKKKIALWESIHLGIYYNPTEV